ncbi:hypothetical protein Pcinc_043356 [Petrolisthes cinctipes]|uniref:Carboxylic ester hydrolase n=1 Tax=Petrolisthes cinctipes TaxID=88211 RepID=A0AAE1BG13_PETCI|nr:hypothetical protein Pcinc_043356 [Petrolisthes cinctipes]
MLPHPPPLENGKSNMQDTTGPPASQPASLSVGCLHSPINFSSHVVALTDNTPFPDASSQLHSLATFNLFASGEKVAMKVVLGLVVVVVMVVMMVRADSEGDSVKVELTQGVVEGVALPTGGTDSNRVYYSFRGIPYAKPPLGKLRFKDPVPAEGWEGIRAPFNPPPCPQLDLIGFFQQKFSPVGEEDCLYLHVYTPKVGETDSPLPVMVYIHGGGFLFGEGDTAGGSALPLLTKDVVLVSLQYRLGALGFISTEDSALPGNMGLRDQTQAFRWVQHNIHSFGGDPDRVTIFGESAGAAAVHFQILSPEAEGLFHRAILQSGTTLNPWALRHDHKQSAISVGKKLGCLGADDDDVEGEALLECLQEIPAGQIVAVGSMSTTEMPFMMFVPRVDGEFLPAHPASLLATGRYNKVDLISGVNKHEGAMSMPGMVMKLSAEGGITVGDLVPIAPDIFGLTQEEGGGKDLAIRALYHYLGDDNTKLTLHPDTTDIMVKMLSDATFIVQHEDIARLHTRDAAYNNSIYLYQLDHRAPITFSTLLGLTIENEWVCHADELQYLFTNVFGFMTLNDHWNRY